MKILYSLVIASLLAFACSKYFPDKRLVEIDKKVDINPHAFLDSLRHIDYKTLSNEDKHYYEFLMVKVTDKAYIDHT